MERRYEKRNTFDKRKFTLLIYGRICPEILMHLGTPTNRGGAEVLVYYLLVISEGNVSILLKRSF